MCSSRSQCQVAPEQGQLVPKLTSSVWVVLTVLQVTYEPEGPEAAELRNWWSTEGNAATITPVGQVGYCIVAPHRFIGT